MCGTCNRQVVPPGSRKHSAQPLARHFYGSETAMLVQLFGYLRVIKHAEEFTRSVRTLLLHCHVVKWVVPDLGHMIYSLVLNQDNPVSRNDSSVLATWCLTYIYMVPQELLKKSCPDFRTRLAYKAKD